MPIPSRQALNPDPLILQKESNTMSNNDYTLFTYEFNGQQVTSAIHWRDVGSFLREHPDAKRKVA